MPIPQKDFDSSKFSNSEASMPCAPVSVIIPCYCCSETINRAMLSVASQTMLPKELILIDDKSPDNNKTINIISKLVAYYSKYFEIKVVKLEVNGGAANARNIGWGLASQPYIALLDADDAWHSKKIEVQYQFMNTNPHVDLCGHGKKIVSKGVHHDWAIDDISSVCISKKKLLITNPFVTPSVMFKKEIALRFNPAKRYVDDHLLWLQIIFNGGKVVMLNTTLVTIFKPMFGSSGLSSNMWAMEKSELNNYWILFRNNNVGFGLTFFLALYSLLKYLRRLIIINLRRITIEKE